MNKTPLSKYRSDTSAPHWLWGGHPGQFRRDRDWRADIPMQTWVGPRPVTSTDDASPSLAVLLVLAANNG